MLTPQDLITAQRANVDTLFAVTGKVFDGVESIVDLNLQVAREGLAEAAELTTAAMSATDAQELLPLQTGVLQPATEKAANYSRRLFEIATATNAEVTKLAESAAARVQEQFTAAVGDAVSNTPAGDDAVSTLIKSAVAAANDAYATMQRAALQAVSAVEAAPVEAAPKPARKTKRTA